LDLGELALKRFQQVSQELQKEIGSLTTRFAFGVAAGIQTLDTDARAKALRDAGHVADLGEHSYGVQLVLNTGRNDNLVLSFHGIGPRYREIVGVVAYLLLQGAEPSLIKDGTFQINYEEDILIAQTRFSAWLERVIVEGLNQWRLTL
jgi:hypothetical protein